MKNNNSNTSLKRGRPPKKDYDPEALMQELIDTAAEIYREKREIKATALELDLPPGKVKKLLITGKVLTYPETKQIQALMRQGKTMAEIETEFAGQGYGTFKSAVGDAVIETLRPIREEASRILQDKAYLESVYKAGAEKASYVANKTLRKVYKKIGFVAR